jgi:hypothetical protein
MRGTYDNIVAAFAVQISRVAYEIIRLSFHAADYGIVPTDSLIVQDCRISPGEIRAIASTKNVIVTPYCACLHSNRIAKE